MTTGYHLSIFENPPEEKYRCLECRLVIKRPTQTYCGHRYCFVCFQSLLGRHNDPVYCKGCSDEGVPDSILNHEESYPDRGILRDLSAYKVRCINNGCIWKGVFKNYQQHVDTCDHEMIHCLHRDGCGASLKRGNLSEHLEKHCPMRMTACPHCNDEYPHKTIPKHLDECDERVAQCQFCKAVTLPWKRLKEHQDPERGNCTNKPQACLFRQVGCDALIPTDDKHRHSKEYITNHQEMLLQTVVSMKPVIERAAEDRGTLDATKELVTNQGKQVAELQRTFTQVQEKLNHFQAVNCHTTLNAKLPREVDSELKLQTDSISGLKNKFAALESKLSTYDGVVGVLNAQLERDSKQLQAMETQRRQDRDLIESLERKVKAQDRIIALKDVALAEQDLRIQSLEMASYDGVMIWKISDFNRKFNEARSGKTTSFYSPCFYTSRSGYKMCARIYLNGDGMGKGNHVSLFFTIMRGPNDALMRWPFRQKVTFMWLDQNNREHVIDAFRPDPTSSSFQRPKNDMNVASGCPLFMPISQIDSPRHAYVKDDTAFVKIIVETSDLP